MARVCLVSLGCPKNLIDSECALGELVRAGHQIAADPCAADVVIVNTCGFIESARNESVEAIEEAIGRKRRGDCRAVVVIGCLSQRLGRELARAEPEIDAVVGVDHAGKLAEIIDSALAGKAAVDASPPQGQWVEGTHRLRSTPPWTAYLKLCDGCDNRCAYCAIPQIRGPFRSRPERLALDEARSLAEAGVRELILVGQDLTQYGADWGRPNSLPALLEKLSEIEPLRWIRLLYCYPTKVSRELIRVVASSPKVLNYMDIPLQHGDDSVLRAMNRRGTSEDYVRLVDDLRAECPEIALRSSFIVGFPGETAEASQRLLRFAERLRFDRVGVFAYSREEGTPAARMPKQVPRRTAERRRDRLMRLQQRISLERNRSLVGRTLEVLVEGECEGVVVGRSYRDAPDIDGLVYVTGSSARPGEFVSAKVTEAREYDLVASAE